MRSKIALVRIRKRGLGGKPQARGKEAKASFFTGQRGTLKESAEVEFGVAKQREEDTKKGETGTRSVRGEARR